MHIEGSGGPRRSSATTGPGMTPNAEHSGGEAWVREVFSPIAQRLLALPPSEREQVKHLMADGGELVNALPPAKLGIGGSSQNFIMILMNGMARLAQLDDQSIANIGEATSSGVQSFGQWLNQVHDAAQQKYMDALKSWSGQDQSKDPSNNQQTIIQQISAANTDYQAQTSQVQSTGSTLASTAQGLTQQSSADAQNIASVCSILQQIAQSLQRSGG